MAGGWQGDRAAFSSLRNRSAGLFGDLGCSSPADLADLLAAFPPGFGKLQRQTHLSLRQREHSNEGLRTVGFSGFLYAVCAISAAHAKLARSEERRVGQ